MYQSTHSHSLHILFKMILGVLGLKLISLHVMNFIPDAHNARHTVAFGSTLSIWTLWVLARPFLITLLGRACNKKGNKNGRSDPNDLEKVKYHPRYGSYRSDSDLLATV